MLTLGSWALNHRHLGMPAADTSKRDSHDLVSSATRQDQTGLLARHMGPSLSTIDTYLAEEGLRLSDRPFRAACDLLRFGFVEINGVSDFDRTSPVEFWAEPWFRAIFLAVQQWFMDRYGAEALEPHSNPPLEGVIVLLGAPFRLRVPMHRNEIEVEGKIAAIHFEAGVAPSENPLDWVCGTPALNRIGKGRRSEFENDVRFVSEALRALQHHSLGVDQDDVQRGLRSSIRSYLEAAADRMRKTTGEELAIAWMDLHMAAEAALKLVIQRANGTHPFEHELTDLLAAPGAENIQFDHARLRGWPRFDRKISNRRYGREASVTLDETYRAYKLVLDLVVACMRTIEPPVPSGFGISLHIAPYLIDEPLIGRRAAPPGHFVGSRVNLEEVQEVEQSFPPIL